MRYKALIAFLFATSLLDAQQELGLSFQPKDFQSIFVNPAFLPEKRLAIESLGFFLDASSSAKIGLRDVFPKNSDGTRSFAGEKLLSKLAENDNRFRASYGIETFGIALRVGNLGFSLTHALRTGGEIAFPKNFVALFYKGNAAFIGQTIEVAPSFNATAWQEIGLGASFKTGPLTVGGRAKIMLGGTAIRSDVEHISIFTDPDIYQITMETNFGFQSAGQLLRLDTSGLGFKLKTHFPSARKVFGENFGLGLDLGARADFGKMTLAASILDIGSSISWKKDANYWLSKGTFHYDGVEFPPSAILNGDSLNLNGKLDSLNKIFAFQKTATTFETRLPTRAYVTATFSPTKNWLLGATLFVQTGGGETKNRQAVALAAHRFFFRKIICAGLQYSLDDRSAANLGASLTLALPYFRAFATSDNVFSSLLPYRSSRVSVRMGASLNF